MSNIRQDAWAEKEDLLLADTVLSFIKEGSTQLAAFEEVGKLLSRTPAACGFRWNSLIRKQYEDAIKIAKQERKELAKKSKINKTNKTTKEILRGNEIAHVPEISLNEVIHFLRGLESKEDINHSLEKKYSELEAEIIEVKKQNSQLNDSLEQLKKGYRMVQGDYKALISIMDRAKRLIGQDKEESISLDFKAIK